MRSLNREGAALRALVSRLAWPLVLFAALALSWWSLDALALRFGVPSVLAEVVSTVFDGAALVLAELSQRYARTQDSAAGSRLLMLATVGALVWLNWQHADLLGYPVTARVLFGAPPAIAGALFEIEQKWTHREALREHGRVAPALPAFGRWAWLLHPAAVVRRVWVITAHRVASVPVDVLDWHADQQSAAVLVAVEPAARPQLLSAAASTTPALGSGPEVVPNLGRELPFGSGREAESGASRAQRHKSARARRVRPEAPATRVAPDAAWLPAARAAVDGDHMPSTRELARRLSVGRDRASRLRVLLAAEQLGGRPMAGQVNAHGEAGRAQV